MIITEMKLYCAITGKISNLVKIKICNDGTGNSARGNYQWMICGRNGRLMKRGNIHNWARNSKTPLALLQRVINDAYPKGVM